MRKSINRREAMEIVPMLLLAAMSQPAWARPGFPSARLGDVLPGLVPQHPRLLMDDGKLAACREKAKTDATYSALIARIILEADYILKEPVVRYNLTGQERPSMLGGSRQIIRKIAHTAFAWRWTGDARYAERARAEMLNAARFPEWNHTHFLDVAETAFGVALGYDWLHTTLDVDDKATIRMALVEKSLLWADRAYRGTDDGWLAYPGFWWNWNPVCNGGVLAAALAVAEDEPQLVRDIIAGVKTSLIKAKEAFDPDGGGGEGPVYWSYGVTFYTLCVAMFEGALGSSMGLTDSPGFKVTDLYRLWVQGPTGAAFNYGDCKERLYPNSALSWLAERNGHPAVTALAHREMLESMDTKPRNGEFDRFFFLYALWYPEDRKVPLDLPKARHFRGESDIACFRGDWTSPNAAYVGFKAGNNGANHSHMDLGSFVLEGQGVRWSSDLGTDSYQIPGYFDGEKPDGKRFGIFRISTAAHSTIMPQGVNQWPKAVAPIVDFANRKDGGHAIVDLSAAYPGHAQSVKRGLLFAKNGRIVHLRDEIAGARAGSLWRWGMVTSASIAVRGARAVLTLDGKRMLAVAHHPLASFEVVSLNPPTTAENPNTGYRMLAVSLPVDADGGLTCAVTLYPLGSTALPIEQRPLTAW